MNMFETCDAENVADLSAPLSSGPMPRWQRKAMERSKPTTPSAKRSNPSTPKQTSSKTPKKTPSKYDRFIPNRSSMDFDVSNYNLVTNENQYGSETNTTYNTNLKETLFDGSQPNNKILSFKQKAPAPREGYQNNMRVLYTQNKMNWKQSAKPQVTRHIPQVPEKILDAPDIVDDYYLNLLDWSCTNMLAVALGPTVYLWNASSGEINELMTTPGTEDYVTSVSWVQDGSYLAVGTNNCETQIWDVQGLRQIRSMNGHTGRIGALSWNAHILSSGSADGNIVHHDVRVAQHNVATLSGHQQEVCGLKWSPDGSQLASGGNDNILNIWDGDEASPRFSLSHHQAAVKALGWCPWQSNLLASGGGTADRMLRFWNTATGACVNSIDTKSQVCSIQWSKNDRELVTSHGFSHNQLSVWKYPSLVKIADLTGHSARVLHMASSPDGSTVVSAAGDETLRFWKVFSPPQSARKSAKSRSSAMARGINIR
eukprot:gb/GECH01011214.1/.p1 GENE.gb/GECH01011214.1/~~gb/GECH01011214.1/.p1  ORF type:complete len:484 (+),score=106.24 gb/GECH01011214.1/:1-1452(+)